MFYRFVALLPFLGFPQYEGHFYVLVGLFVLSSSCFKGRVRVEVKIFQRHFSIRSLFCLRCYIIVTDGQNKDITYWLSDFRNKNVPFGISQIGRHFYVVGKTEWESHTSRTYLFRISITTAVSATWILGNSAELF